MRCWLQFIDTGVVYGNEGDIGKALKEELSAGKVKREDLFICSKLNQDQHSESGAYNAVKGSLKDLNLDYIDLYLIHWPLTDKPGPELNPPAQVGPPISSICHLSAPCCRPFRDTLRN